jgi:hypothetical protein
VLYRSIRLLDLDFNIVVELVDVLGCCKDAGALGKPQYFTVNSAAVLDEYF